MAAQYKLNARTFIKADGTAEAWLHEVGETLFYSGVPGPSMDPLNAEAIAAKAAEAAASASPIGPTRAGRWDAYGYG
jgi:hypothetical protein